MGENNCAWNRHLTIHKETLAAAAAIYKGIINLLLLSSILVAFLGRLVICSSLGHES